MLKGTDLGPEDPDSTWEHQAKSPGLEGKELRPSAHVETEPEGKLQCGAASKTWEWGPQCSGASTGSGTNPSPSPANLVAC